MIVAGGGLIGLTEWAPAARDLGCAAQDPALDRDDVATMVMIVPMSSERPQKAMQRLEAQIKAQAAALIPVLAGTDIRPMVG